MCTHPWETRGTAGRQDKGLLVGREGAVRYEMKLKTQEWPWRGFQAIIFRAT